jgi:hypothetical protein
MSSSAGDAGSSSAEATNFEDYNTTSSYSGYDEAGISTPTTSYDSIGTTGYDEAGTTTPSYAFDSIGTTGYDEAGITTPSYSFDSIGTTGYDDAYVIGQPSTITGPTDPGVAGTYVDGKFVPSQDTIKGIPGYIQNIQAEYASNPLSFLLSPLGTAAKVAGQTLAANYMLGNFPSFSISGRTSSMQDAGTYSSDGGDQLQSYLTPIAPYAITGATPQQSQVMQYFNNMGTTQSPLSSSLETSYNQAKANVNNLLGVGSLQGQFGYSTQPYGGLSANNLATNPFNIPYLQQRGLI